MNFTIHTDGFDGFSERSLERAKKMDRGERIEPSFGITFESPMQMFEVLTAARVRMVEVARTKPYSVTALAKKLKRGRSAAHAAGDQSGAWAGEDRGAGGAELRVAGEILEHFSCYCSPEEFHNGRFS
jgi:hypothetical protein